MNQRLQQFLDLENITPARLSDILNVQRSSISHILNGRNKPSYDFIRRILSKFPALNADWLLTGRGKPYKENTPPISSTENSLRESKSRYGNHPDLRNSSNHKQEERESGLFAIDDYNMVIPDKALHSAENENNVQQTNSAEPYENQKNTNDCTTTKQNRKVKSVVIFYDDGSFEELKPEK